MATTVEELLAASKSALARGDVAAIVARHHENVCFPTAGGGFDVGRAALAEYLETMLAMVPHNIVHEATSEHIHHVTPDLAIIDTVGTNYRKLATGDREFISVEGFTMIAIREEGVWRWAGMRGALVPKA